MTFSVREIIGSFNKRKIDPITQNRIFHFFFKKMLIKEVSSFFFLCFRKGHAYVSKHDHYVPSMENGRASHKHKHSHTARSRVLLFTNYSNADGISPLMHMALK